MDLVYRFVKKIFGIVSPFHACLVFITHFDEIIKPFYKLEYRLGQTVELTKAGKLATAYSLGAGQQHQPCCDCLRCSPQTQSSHQWRLLRQCNHTVTQAIQWDELTNRRRQWDCKPTDECTCTSICMVW